MSVDEAEFYALVIAKKSSLKKIFCEKFLGIKILL